MVAPAFVHGRKCALATFGVFILTALGDATASFSPSISPGRDYAVGFTLFKLCGANLAAAQENGFAAVLHPPACTQNLLGVASYALASEL